MVWRSECRRGWLAVVAVVLAGLGACSTFHSRYFQRIDTSEVRLGRFRVLPRIFAYQDEKAGSGRVVKGVFTVTVRVEDTVAQEGEYAWQPGQAATDSAADMFLQEWTDEFGVDSLALHPIPALSRSIILKHDVANYAPRREDYLTLRFGETAIPLAAEGLRVVLHVTRPGLPPRADSAVIMMMRVESEERGLMMFRDKVHGY